MPPRPLAVRAASAGRGVPGGSRANRRRPRSGPTRALATGRRAAPRSAPKEVPALRDLLFVNLLEDREAVAERVQRRQGCECSPSTSRSLASARGGRDRSRASAAASPSFRDRPTPCARAPSRSRRFWLPCARSGGCRARCAFPRHGSRDRRRRDRRHRAASRSDRSAPATRSTRAPPQPVARRLACPRREQALDRRIAVDQDDEADLLDADTGCRERGIEPLRGERHPWVPKAEDAA